MAAEQNINFEAIFKNYAYAGTFLCAYWAMECNSDGKSIPPCKSFCNGKFKVEYMHWTKCLHANYYDKQFDRN